MYNIRAKIATGSAGIEITGKSLFSGETDPVP
jgi:hypothetical protein